MADMSTVLSTATTDENVERIPEIMCAYKWKTIDAIDSKLGLSHSSIHIILHDDLKMNNIVFFYTWL
ncbi:hypothetical protein TNCT_618941 [Trichonephila clavata]|uniref:Uncharacterized protein n=1 Tax=Trichonephila clavata TaxID=2740835 RepID=A0A8X6L035_TRICU|nr:hypothetical protein TNCT_618941 [Trichonephila clavata]